MGLLAAAAVAAAAALADDVLPESGPLRPQTMKRLLVADGARVGNRVVASATTATFLASEDGGVSWRRAKSPRAPLLTALQFIDGQRGWAVGHDTMILATADAARRGGCSFPRRRKSPACSASSSSTKARHGRGRVRGLLRDRPTAARNGRRER
jgi:photosystem II stability/assembly factor-like uncharacterized protein